MRLYIFRIIDKETQDVVGYHEFGSKYALCDWLEHFKIHDDAKVCITAA